MQPIDSAPLTEAELQRYREAVLRGEYPPPEEIHRIIAALMQGRLRSMSESRAPKAKRESSAKPAMSATELNDLLTQLLPPKP